MDGLRISEVGPAQSGRMLLARAHRATGVSQKTVVRVAIDNVILSLLAECGLHFRVV
jgi:hypothetical protein